jgi:hypothetical protein
MNEDTLTIECPRCGSWTMTKATADALVNALKLANSEIFKLKHGLGRLQAMVQESYHAASHRLSPECWEDVCGPLESVLAWDKKLISGCISCDAVAAVTSGESADE